MRIHFIIATLLLFSVSASSQSEKWKQKNARLNFAFAPQFEYVKIAGQYAPTASFSGSIAFNNTFFIGGYATKKIIRQYVPDPFAPPAEIDANYQHAGLELLYSIKLGLYRTKGGHYVHPKIRIVVGTRVGGGFFVLDDINKEPISVRDYFYFIQPEVGVAYPINDYITLHGGFCFTSAIKVNLLDEYFPGKDFMGPGIYLATKITIFK